MTRLTSLLVVVFAILAQAIPAEAQYGRARAYEISRAIAGDGYGSSYYRGYNRYDRDPRMTDPCYGADQFYQGVRGTIHAQKGVMHFRSCDPTNNRIGTIGGGALGAGGGALIGSLGGRKGAAVGTVGGAVVGGILGSRRAHDNCVVMQSHQTASPNQQTPSEEPVEEEQATQPVAGPASSQGVGGFELSNSTRMYVEAYDGQTYLGRMAPGTSLRVGPPKDRYQGFALIPNRNGGLSKDEIDVQPGNTGWTFTEPEVAQEG